MALDLTGIHNVGEFYSHHYLSAVIEGDLKALFKSWKEREAEGGAKAPWKQLKGLSNRYFTARTRADDERDEAERGRLARGFHVHLLEALGYPYKPAVEPVFEAAVPVLLAAPRDGNPFLWVVDAPFPAASAEDPDPFEARPLAAQLPAASGDATLPDQTWRELLDGDLFRIDEPPRWVLFLAGGDAFLLDRHKWAEGRYLHFELADLFARQDTKALMAVAGLLHREALNPDDGLCLHDTLDESSHKHAFEVSTDLKHGARRAIELVANEVIRYRRETLHVGVFDDNDLADTLKRECVVYLYRLLFLFYVEARGAALEVVPMQSDAYRHGYSLETLRDLELVPLTTEKARNGFFIHESLQKLFQLVNRGTHRRTRERELAFVPEHETFSIAGLRSPLFDEERTPLLQSARLRNVVLQEVLQSLSLSRPGARRRGRRRERGRISYAQLGINQLGAVYEGLLSFSGFFAQEPLLEVRARNEVDDEDARTFFVPEREKDLYEPEELVRDPNGTPRRHAKGRFIFRLSGRDREKSASYYTPEVLTRCLTKYTLKERLEGLTADEILALTVCEPAMGSGAFLNEAVGQLADAYLERKQRELGETIPSDEYQHERQRVKAYLTVHNVYGVDLNPLAAELGKLSLWLNVLHKGARAPYLDLRIATGNSLIGGRREVFLAADLSFKGSRTRGPNWLGKVPARVPLREARPGGTVYHFLVPDKAMVAFDKNKVVKQLVPDAVARVKAWRKEITKPYTKTDIGTLERISARVDALFAQHLVDRRAVLAETRQPDTVWGQPAPDVAARWRSVEECEEWAARLQRGTAAGRRLAAVMDYWCALWFWPLERAELLPTRSEWLTEVDGLLDGDVDALAARVPRIGLVRDLTKRSRFLHWEIAFPEVFAGRGGFDVVLGNPPWVKVQWQEQGILGDLDPHLVVRRLSKEQASTRRAKLLAAGQPLSAYLAEFEDQTGTPAYLNAEQNYAVLKGVQTNLYKCFIARAWRVGRGVVGLLHQQGILDDPRGGRFRAALLPRLRWAAQCKNQLKLFAEVHHERPYSFTVSATSPREKPNFRLISNLFHPRTLDESLAHDGHGSIPGIKTTAGDWDLRGHRSRIVEVTEETLALFAKLYDPPGTPALEARLPVVHSAEILSVLRKFASAPQKLGDLSGQYFATVCFDETYAQRDGTIKRETRFPKDPTEWIVSGPHFYVGTPFNKTPNEGCSHNQDYSVIDLEAIPDDYLPRTNYVPACSPAEYRKRTPEWRGRPVTEFYRHVHRRLVAPTGERTLVPAIIPPTVAHIHPVLSVTYASHAQLVAVEAMATSLIFDFFIKTTGKSDVYGETFAGIAFVSGQYACLGSRRVLRLNCLTIHYAPLWEELYDAAFHADGFAKPDPRLKPWTDLTPTWQRHCALRTPFGRRQALVELDALAALALNLTADELCLLYRVQFPVLQQYERETYYDRRGRIVFTVNRGLAGVGVTRKQWNEIKTAQAGDTLPDWAKDGMGPYVPPFDRCDREDDMRQAYEHFQTRLS